MKSGFKRTINWNKYQPNVEQIFQNPQLNHLIDPRFQGLKQNFLLSFENATYRAPHTGYYLMWNVMIYKEYRIYILCYDWWENRLDWSLRDDVKTYVNTKKIAVGQGDVTKLVGYLIIIIPNKIISWLQQI